MTKKIFISFYLIFISLLSFNAQTFQNIRGVIVDQDTQRPIWGATIVLLGSDPMIAVNSDLDGNFIIQNVPIGRASIQVSSISYETQTLNEIVVNSAKEVVLEISLLENIATISKVEIEAKKEKTENMNEMTLISGKMFSVEETNRYAGTFGDPARMASNFAGVNSDAEGDNNIVVRGNSPKGILWRMEGIEIPNPNHFAEEGSTGGPINALNGKMLGNSDFLSGAFAPEYGNALSGVFDIRLRTGNNQKREFSLGLGVLGMDVTAEGPIAKDYNGSYLVNYRYSSLAMLEGLGILDFDGVPKYQDLAFKVKLPSQKIGTFTLFGLGGESHTIEESFENEEGLYEYENDDFSSYFGIIGLKNSLLLDEKSYLVTTVSGTANGSGYRYDYGSHQDSIALFENERLDKFAYRFSSQYNRKINSKNKVSFGFIQSMIDYQFLIEERESMEENLIKEIDQSKRTSYSQAHFTLKHRLNEKATIVGGLHYLRFNLNETQSLEPRLAMDYAISSKSRLSIGYGLHSKIESLLNYTALIPNEEGLFSQSNLNMEMPKAHHFVIGHDYLINENTHIKSELYFQKLFDIAVLNNEQVPYSLLNSTSWFTNFPLENMGEGRNYGLELTLERFYSNNFYYLVTTSLFKSEYKAADNQWRDSKFDANYVFNVLVGKEFNIGDSNKNQTLGTSVKINYTGGNRFTPIDLESSMEIGEEVRDYSNPFSSKADDIFFLNIGVNYKVNRSKATHELKFELLNATNNDARINEFYDQEEQELVYSRQLSLIPNLMYVISF